MTDIECTAPAPGLLTDPGAVYLEADASADQTLIVSGTTAITAIDTVQVDQDPSDRFTLLPSGAVQINEAGFAVVDYSFAIERTSVANIDELIAELLVNTTPACWDARLAPLGAAQPTNGCLPATGIHQSFHLGMASWFNAGDVLTPQLIITGPGTVRVIRNNDPGAGNGPSTYMTAMHLGPGVAPYSGSVWP